MLAILYALGTFVADLFKSRSRLEAENLFLRYQLNLAVTAEASSHSIVRQAVGRSLYDQSRTIRVPVHIAEAINKIRRTRRQMFNEIGREPTPEELGKKLGMPIEKVRKVLQIAKQPLSLETPIGEEEDSHLGDLIEDKNAILPIDAMIQSNLRETTTRVLASLTPREERIVRMRFGLGMNSDHTLEEVGQQFSVTRERIRQIEAKAIRKLKHPSRSRVLRSFLDN